MTTFEKCTEMVESTVSSASQLCELLVSGFTLPEELLQRKSICIAYVKSLFSWNMLCDHETSGSKLQGHIALSLVATLNWVNVILYRLRDSLSIKQANSLITQANVKVPC